MSRCQKCVGPDPEVFVVLMRLIKLVTFGMSTGKRLYRLRSMKSKRKEEVQA